MMSNDPQIAFVWPPEKISDPVIRMAQSTSIRIIFDLTQAPLQSVLAQLEKITSPQNGLHVRVGASDATDTLFEKFIARNDIASVWIDTHIAFHDTDIDRIIQSLSTLSNVCACVPIVSDVHLLVRFLENGDRISHIAVKGCEAAGFVGSESTLTLFTLARKYLSQKCHCTNLYIWGGIVTADAATAFLDSGANGIVFESLHWLTDAFCPNNTWRKKVARLGIASTELIGTQANIPVRLFNKGNSLAVRDIKAQLAAIAGKDALPEILRDWKVRISRKTIPPHLAEFNRHELVPLGVEAAFADAFAEHYGRDLETAIQRFIAEIENSRANITDRKHAFLAGGPVQDFGIRYPFIQGAMTWISDSIEFARSISDAGGLPTLALGLMDRTALDRKLGSARTELGNRWYAVNFLALPENPFLTEQLAWIREQQPPLAVIAAGDPAVGKEIQAYVRELAYIAPDIDLLNKAIRNGIRYVVCEGNEAGGHVGHHTILTLAQAVQVLKRQHPEFMRDCRIVLAGGFFNAATVSIAALLGADAVQMGTAYLCTEEIVTNSALKRHYQDTVLAASPGDTVITGQSVGLPVRSLQNEKTATLFALEHEYQRGYLDETTCRQKFEHLSSGSLYIAARGTDYEGKPLTKEECLSQGQFMSGTASGFLNHVQSIKKMHAEIATGLAAPTDIQQKTPPWQDLRRSNRNDSPPYPKGSKGSEEKIAITGMSMVNSLGNTPEQVWSACVNGQSGVTFVPPSRWNHDLYFDPRPYTPDKTYCRVAGFKNLSITRQDLATSPQDFASMSSATRLTIYLARQVIQESGIATAGISPERIGVFVAQNSGERAGTMEDIILRSSSEKLAHTVQRTVPLTSEQTQSLIRQIKAKHKAIDDTTLLGRLNSTAAGFISNQYNFLGPSFSISAACATSLAALFCAVQMIRRGIIDAALVGGGEEDLTVLDFLEFSALGVLAGFSGVQRAPEAFCRPFDRDRDGMVLGEGGAMIVVEKASTARARDAWVHGYITGMGASNNPHGLVEPDATSQKLAMQSAFHEAADYGFDMIDLVECHATGTRKGDMEELQALCEVHNGNTRTFLTSLKSQTGHTLGAAGMSNLIRGVLAMQHRTLPPTINYENPDPALTAIGTGLTVLPEAVDWPCRNGQPRRLQVNAFGFGGSNYVALIEESHNSSDSAVCHVPPLDTSKPADTYPSTLPGLFFFRRLQSDISYRIGLLADSQADAFRQAQEFEPCHNSQVPADTGDIFLEKYSKTLYAGYQTSTLAFVFPGQGCQYPAMGKELCTEIPEINQTLTHLATQLDFDLMDFLFTADEKKLQDTCRLQPALFCLQYALFTFLARREILPDAVAGHSLGELAAMCTANVFSPADGLRLVTHRARCMQQAAEQNNNSSLMLAVNAPFSIVQKILSSEKNIYITNINTPDQIVVGGPADAVDKLRHQLSQQNIRHTRLNVAMAFHSPMMRTVRKEFADFVASIPFSAPRFPVVSATTGKPLPDDPDKIRSVLVGQLESPVQWLETVQTLREVYNIQSFLEIGPGDVLSRLIEATDHSPICMPTCIAHKESRTLKTAQAYLFACGRYEPPPSIVHEITGAPASVPDTREEEPPVWADCVDHNHHQVDDIIRQEIEILLSQPVSEVLRSCLLKRIQAKCGLSFSESQLNQYLDQYLASETGTMGRTLLAKPAPEAPENVGHMPKRPLPSFQPSGDQKDFRNPAAVLEAVIEIIMYTTGYERDEIEPDMDLREDLSIRSTRIPVILDAMESVFGYPFELEEFIGVRTVQDMALRTSACLTDSSPAAVKTYKHSAEQPVSCSEPVRQAPDPRRLVMEEQPLKTESPHLLQLKPSDRVAFFSALTQNHQSLDLQSTLENIYSLSCSSFPFPRPSYLPNKNTGGEPKLQDLTGLVFVLSSEGEPTLKDAQQTAKCFQDFFDLLQNFLRSPFKKFVLLICHVSDQVDLSDVFVQGVAGMFLSAAQEFKDTLFRIVYADEQTDLDQIIIRALDTALPEIEQIWRNNALYTPVWRPQPNHFHPIPDRESLQTPVVLVSGGGQGITSHLIRALAPFEPHLVLIGRTQYTPTADDSDVSGNPIRQTLSDLQTMGIHAEYRACDVLDPDALQVVVNDVVSRYGRIDGIIHGAGILRDRLMCDMTMEDFNATLQVKLQGAWNLFYTAKAFGLKFFVALSSVVAVHGNLGQANYACANRALSALLQTWARELPHIRWLALLLPPIDGTGMAVEQETRKLMYRKGWGPDTYLSVDEVAHLLCQELVVQAGTTNTVLFAKSLPDRTTSQILGDDSFQSPDCFYTPTMSFSKQDFPLIDAVKKFDLQTSVIQTVRTFTQVKDLWLADHKPFKFINHPLVAAIMVIESFMEAAELLFPYLQVHRVENAVFEEMIECPPGLERTATIVCRYSHIQDKEIHCQASLDTYDISPKGRKLEQRRPNFTADLVLSGLRHRVQSADIDFTIKAEELEASPKNTSEMMNWYRKATDFTGRYLLLRGLDGYGPGVICGKAVYPEDKDFNGHASNRYRYPAYALEAALQLVAAYHTEMDTSPAGFLIPLQIKELVFLGNAAAGDEIKIEARQIAENTEGASWEARCLKSGDIPILHIRGIRMHRIYE